MPQVTDKDKFIIHAAEKDGDYKGRKCIEVNLLYNGGTDSITIQDLINFLKKNGVKPSQVPLGGNFLRFTKV